MIQTLKVWGQVWNVERPGHYRGYPVRSTAWVCSKCLRMWALYENFDESTLYRIQSAPCQDCPEAAHEILRPVPGSLINDWTGLGGIDEDLLDALPLELVKIEFSLTLEAWETIWLKKAKAFSPGLMSLSRDQQAQERPLHLEPSPTQD